jgi:hypothetical protein
MQYANVIDRVLYRAQVPGKSCRDEGNDRVWYGDRV